MEPTDDRNPPAYYVYQVRDKDGQGDTRGPGIWTKIGAAWANKDGKGFSITLDAVPLHGRLVMREPKERGDERTE